METQQIHAELLIFFPQDYAVDNSPYMCDK